MKYIVKQIHPLDLKPNIGIGVKIPFFSGDVFRTTFTTSDAIKTNLINFLLTGTFERYMNPNLGIGLRELLFEQNIEDTALAIDFKIKEGISQYFPTVIIEELQINSSPDTNTVNIFLRYSIRNTNIQDQLLINIEQ
jgi:phage baseplate assembly protein W